ncbi:MAG: hypothetical protein R3B47_13535 [Bacteroidia bacterium]
MARILIVDDNEDILLAARIVLKSFDIQTTANPHEIERIIDAQHIDAVLLT